MPFGLSQRDVDLIRQTLSKLSEVQKAIVFGSRAKGNAEPGADIDIALKGESVTEKTVLTLVTAQEELPLPYFYDIVAYHNIQNQDLIEHIDRVEGVLYERGNPW